MVYTVFCEHCGQQYDIQKPMAAELPHCAVCGRQVRRVFDEAPAVQYQAAGFYTTDHVRFERAVGRERAAKFSAAKHDAEQRARRGQLTRYEKSLEGI